MLNQYLLEYIGSLIIAYALVFTHENPIIIGLTHTGVLYLASQHTLKGHFTPLSVMCDILLKRLELFEGLKLIGIHFLAVLSIVFIYIPLQY